MRSKPFRLPKHIRINTHIKYKVVEVDTFDDPLQLGECDQALKTITLKRKMSQKKKHETLWHEILHAMVFESDIKLDDSVEETIIKNVERPLARIMRLNNLLF